MEHKSEPDYTLGFTVSRDIHFDKHGNIIVPAHVEPLIFREQGYGSSTPTGSRHEQRKKKGKNRRHIPNTLDKAPAQAYETKPQSTRQSPN